MVWGVLNTYMCFQSNFAAFGINQTHTFSLRQFVWQYFTKHLGVLFFFFLEQWSWCSLIHPLGSSAHALVHGCSNDLPDHHVIMIADSSLGSGVRTRKCHRFSNQMLRNFKMQPQETSKERHENLYHDELWKWIQESLFWNFLRWFLEQPNGSVFSCSSQQVHRYWGQQAPLW